jgi:hypothetical protein
MADLIISPDSPEKNPVTSWDIFNVIDYLYANTVLKVQIGLGGEIAPLEAHALKTVGSRSIELRDTIKDKTMDTISSKAVGEISVSVGLVVLKFFLWVAENLIKDSKLKIRLWDYPKTIKAIIVLIIDIIGAVKTSAKKDALLPTVN